MTALGPLVPPSPRGVEAQRTCPSVNRRLSSSPGSGALVPLGRGEADDPDLTARSGPGSRPLEEGTVRGKAEPPADDDGGDSRLLVPGLRYRLGLRLEALLHSTDEWMGA